MKSAFQLIQIFSLTCALLLFLPLAALAHPHITDVNRNAEITPDLLLDDLRQVQVIFMGEFHNHAGHHQAQLAIIKALNAGGRPLAIGLEMFRQDSQEMLDRWTASILPLGDFKSVYEDNWSLWPVYEEIFLYARAEGLKMIGLNIPRDLPNKVAMQGFDALSDEERMLLGNVQCNVSTIYRDYISKAMAGHSGHGTQFLHFCQAQLLWDILMARNLVNFIEKNPDYQVVVMVGSAHAWKFGVPRQMLRQADIDYRVLLPEIQGRIDKSVASREVTDYLWLDVGDDGWSF